MHIGHFIKPVRAHTIKKKTDRNQKSGQKERSGAWILWVRRLAGRAKRKKRGLDIMGPASRWSVILLSPKGVHH